MLCGLLSALSVLSRFAICVPALDPQGAAGGDAGRVNVTTSVLEPPAGTPAVQFFSALKLPGGFTVAAPTLNLAAPAPRLVTVTVR
jgi:hypothetical protein